MESSSIVARFTLFIFKIQNAMSNTDGLSLKSLVENGSENIEEISISISIG
jgi:hypothetical protein